VAYEIPPEIPNFVDRDLQQAMAARAVEEWAAPSRPLCLGLRGLGGAGKTELAFRIARTLRDRFPDGVLYLDLDDLRRDGAVEAMDALGELLRSLGVGSEWLGHSFKARCKQYWTQTDGKRLVVVIDNARYGSEVLPLLPASGDGLVIVTSQGPLYDLPSGAVVDLQLGPLEDVDALELLRGLGGDARLAEEPEAADGLLRLCSGLPAALQVAGRWLVRHRRRSLSRLVDELTAELHEKGVPVVERLWDAAYRSVGADAALLYRLLPVIPGASFTPAAAAAVFGKGRDAAEDALEELETAGLLDIRAASNTKDERKRLPELLRGHAQRCARRDSSEEERSEALRRIVAWHVRQAQRADLAAAGERLRLADLVAPLPGAPDVPFEDAERPKQHAVRWLHTERHALYGCVRSAYAHGYDAAAWALCEPLWTHYLDHPEFADTVEAFHTGVAAAQRAGHLPALVRMRCQLARPLWEQGRFDEAAGELRHAMAAAESLDETKESRKLRASVIEFRGTLRSAQGDWEAATGDFEASREIQRLIGNDYGVMLQTYRIGQATAESGDLDRAASLLEEAHRAAAGLQRERMTARTGFALAGVLHRLGRGDEARELYQAVLAAARGRGSDFDEARVLDALAALADDSGDPVEAQRHREAVHAIRARNGSVD
jgi:tetratricopeptide (TPR) repeat protein